MKINVNTLNTIAYRINKILEEIPETRNNDMLLIDEYKKRYYSEFTYTDIMRNNEQVGFPSFETITRARRKCQEKKRNLANEKVSKIRNNLQKEYREFARG